jgi:hypothetical protein
VEALLDYRGGLELYHRDESWHRGVIAHYEFNLRRMTSIARRAGVPLILMNPACQLRHSPPFKAEHRSQLTEQERQHCMRARFGSGWIQTAAPTGKCALCGDTRYAREGERPWCPRCRS